MTIVVTHPFISAKPAGNDPTRIYGPNWNANHTIAGTADATQLNANVVQAVVNDTNIQGSIAAQTLTFAWGGTLAAARLNANVVQAITNDTNVTGTISAQNLTLGWTGQLGLVRGGTNADLSATGGTHQVLKQSGVGSAVTVGQLAFTDISGTASAAQLPNPTASTLGGVESYVAVSHQWINTISTSGVPSSTQPAIADISGWGTGVATAVGVNIGSAGAPVLFNGAGGTPSSLTLTNATGLPLTGLANQAAWTILFNNTSGSAAPTANTIDGLTVKASPAAGDELMIWDVAGTAIKKATVSSLTAASGVSSIAGNTGAFTLTAPITNATNAIVLNAPLHPQGRLTLVTVTPVMTSTQSGKTTVFYTPYQGNLVPIYDGTNMIPTAVAEVSQLTTDATKSPAAVAASSVYDVFVWNDAGTLRATRGPAWTNTTTRSAGTALTMVNGILLNNASITNGPAASRGTYVGTIASNGSSTIDYIFGAAASGGTAAVLNVWNAYNRVSTGTIVTDNGASYTYSSITIRQSRASAGNQISFVLGLQEDAVQASNGSEGATVAASGAAAIWGIGFDSTTTFGAQRAGVFSSSTTLTSRVGSASVGSWFPAIGVHVLSANEGSDGTNANTFNISSVATLSATIRN